MLTVAESLRLIRYGEAWERWRQFVSLNRCSFDEIGRPFGLLRPSFDQVRVALQLEFREYFLMWLRLEHRNLVVLLRLGNRSGIRFGFLLLGGIFGFFICFAESLLLALLSFFIVVDSAEVESLLGLVHRVQQIEVGKLDVVSSCT